MMGQMVQPHNINRASPLCIYMMTKPQVRCVRNPVVTLQLRMMGVIAPPVRFIALDDNSDDLLL